MKKNKFLFVFLYLISIIFTTQAQDRYLADSLVQVFLSSNTENRSQYLSPIFTKSYFKRWGNDSYEQFSYILLQIRSHIPCQEYIHCTRLIASNFLEHEDNLDKALRFCKENLTGQFPEVCCQVEKESAAYELHFLKKQYAQGIEILDRGIRNAEKNNCHEQRIAYLLNKANVLQYYASVHTAVVLLLHTAELSEQLPLDDEKRGEVWSILGNVNYRIKNYVKAEKYWRKALKYYTKFINRKTGCLNNIALAIQKQERLPEALAAYDSALEAAVQGQNTAWIGIITGNIGNIYFDQGDYEKAIPLLQKNINFSIKTSQWGNVALSYPKLAKCLIKRKDFERAKIYLDSLDWLVKYTEEKSINYGFFNWLEVKMEKNSALSAWYAAQGFHQEAYQYQTQYIEDYKKFESERNSQDINKIQTELEVERKERENLLLKKQNYEDQSEIQKQQILNTVIVVFLLFFIAISLVFYRMMRQRQYLHSQLFAQKEEIISQKEELSQQNAQLEQLNSTKNRLFAIISHDLRSPINNLKGVVEIIDMDLPKAQQKQILQDTARLMDNTFQTLENLLNWAKWQMDGVQYFPQTIDIQEIAQQICSLFSQAAASKNILLENGISEKTFVWVDRDQIELILRNLIGNALKFTPEGGKVWLKSKIIETENKIQICVEDNGVGISEDRLTKLLDNQQINSTRGTAGEKGTGLGLVMCREFIEKNGGVLTVKNKIGEGAVFCFTLPILSKV